ncbi:MAG: hypothetical protein KDJ37_08745 [Hyphomicrobiaceae bacterium]|nr:hypothetical protein [Hyphomicrobiaceae bacterium]
MTALTFAMSMIRWIAARVGVPAALHGFGGVAAVAAIILGGALYVRHEIVAAATAKADRTCEARIAAADKVKQDEEEARAKTAEDAADGIRHAGTRATLERVCTGDAACRDRPH